MDKAKLTAKRAELAKMLASYESGRVTHYDEDETGQLRKDVTAERIVSVRQQIADIDRRLAETDLA